MNTFQTHTNNLAISLSVLCAIHCLAFPLVVLFLPNVAVMGFDNEAVHKWLLVGVIPFSVYSLSLGCKKHKRHHLLGFGFVGLALMIMAVVIGGEVLEKVFTLTGTIILAVAHYMNYRFCRNDRCDCSESE